MIIKAAIKERHTVCKYTDQAIADDFVGLLQARIKENNKNYSLNMALVTGNAEGIWRSSHSTASLCS